MLKLEFKLILQQPHGNLSISGIKNGKIKPETEITVNWGASIPNSGVISSYEIRYTVNDGSSYTIVSEYIESNVRTYTFLPIVREGQILKIQIRAKNSYEKYSNYSNFNSVSVYADGMSVGKVTEDIKNIRGYIKINGEIKKVKNIKVKINGNIYNIDQFLPPLN